MEFFITFLHLIGSFFLMGIIYTKTKDMYFSIVFVLFLGLLKETSDFFNEELFSLKDISYDVSGIILYYIKRNLKCLNTK